ncbi:hypothetical protein B7494_g3982 [Chlorociboria aeruginascens]|nr:hypothetical protein B7494_g3982 [Chlorociboria aeruginascens]
MFYSETLLSKTGPLARVWLSANLERKLSKNHILQASVKDSVEAIVTPNQAPMALRLSGQLLLGVVRIYSRKARYLLDDCNEALMKIKMAFRLSGNNDIPAGLHMPSRDALMLPDVLTEGDNLEMPPMPDASFLLSQMDDETHLGRKQRAGSRDINLQEDFESSQFLQNSIENRNLLDDDLALDDVDLELDLGVDFGLDDFNPKINRSIEIGMDAPAARAADDDLLSDFDIQVPAKDNLGGDHDTSLNLGFGDEDDGFRMGDDDGDVEMFNIGDQPDISVAPLVVPREMSMSPLSDIDEDLARAVEAEYQRNLDSTLYEPKDETEQSIMRNPAQRARRQRLLELDTNTTIPSKQIKEQQASHDKILRPQRFLPRDPELLALMEMQKNGGFVSSIMGEGRSMGWAPELRGLLSLDAVRKSGELKRKRDSGIADMESDQEQAHKSPRLDLGEEEDIGLNLGGDAGLDGGNTTIAPDGTMMEIPGDDRFTANMNDDTPTPGAGPPEEFASPGPNFDDTTAPLVHPADNGPVSLGTKHAVHLLRDRFGAEAADSPDKRKKASVLFQDLLPEATTSRVDATKMFFEVLVLATKDAVKVEQQEVLLGGPIRVRGKRGLWGAWAEREAGGEIAEEESPNAGLESSIAVAVFGRTGVLRIDDRYLKSMLFECIKEDIRWRSGVHIGSPIREESIADEYASLSLTETAERLQTSLTTGLSPAEALARLHDQGPNELLHDPPEPLWLRFLKQFKEPLIILLLCSAGASLVVGNKDDAISIAVAVTIVVSVGFIQEYRSEKSIEALSHLVPNHAHLIRGKTRNSSLRTPTWPPSAGEEPETQGLMDSSSAVDAEAKAEVASTKVMAAQLVPGDLVLFTTGDRIPADIRVTKASDLTIDESNLTGENEPVRISVAARTTSTPVTRSALSTLGPPEYSSSGSGTVGADTHLNNTTNIAFMGTLVRSGHGQGIVYATGGNTHFGTIAASVSETESPRTPLQLSMDALGSQLSQASFAIIALISLVGWFQGKALLEIFTISISLAVAAIPEGLPIIVTVTLALGVHRMARHHAIVRKMPSVETLGSVNVVCSDKTGTLTMNHMSTTKMWHFDAVDPIDVHSDDSIGEVKPDPVILRILRIGNIANNARISHFYAESASSAAVLSSTQGRSSGSSLPSRWVGQPTDVAMLDLLDRYKEHDARKGHGNRIGETPFSSERKWMGVTIGDNGAEGSSVTKEVAYIKGAVDRVLDRCDTYLTREGREVVLDASRRKQALDAAEKLAEEGLRVLGFASGPVYKHTKSSTQPTSRASTPGLKLPELTTSHGDDVYKGLVFAGLVGMSDPPRPGVQRSIRRLMRGGVKVIMITGDADTTALAIGKKLGMTIASPREHTSSTVAVRPVLRGDEIDHMSDEELEASIANTSIFARTSPDHKMRIIRALQARGDIVAMTGDGVNDAPALKKADIGISMGLQGTDVAKEAADMILTDDDFSTILRAIEEGKGIFNNIQNFLTFQLSTSAAALSLVFFCTCFGFKNPLNAMQILWINIIMDGPPAQSLGVEPVDPDVMTRPPRKRNAPVLTWPLITRVLTSAVIIMCGTMLVYTHEMLSDGAVSKRDTTMTFTCFVLFDMFNALNCRSESKSVLRGEVGLFSNTLFNWAVSLSLGGQILVIYFPWLQEVFQTEALGLMDLIALVVLASTVFWADETRKYWKTPSIYVATSVASIRAALSSLHTRERTITTRLHTLITSQSELSHELGRLDLLRAHLGTQVVNTRSISNNMLDSASDTAAALSGKVKALDLEKKRVEETLGVVEQVSELKACVQGVVGSMGAPQDWEAAAGYISRSAKIPREIVEGKFAARTVPSVEVPDAPGVTIENAKESLCGLFLREFEKAAEEGDGVRVTRFFKLFPLIGREDMGLEVYGKYVCQGVAGTARKNLRDGKGKDVNGGFFYANAVTKLFEHIAQIVEGHGGLVERHYGVGRMVRVIEKLQMEADVQGGIILDTWSDEKGVDRRLTDVKSYPFSFLVQSFLPSQRPSGIARTNSPAAGVATNGRTSEDEGVDMKEVDGILSEIALMLSRWSLYSRFLAGKCRVSPGPILSQAISKLYQDPESSSEEPLVVPDLLVKSNLSRKISARLTTPFNIMTTFFFRRSVEKAFQLDELPTGLSLSKPIDGNPPYIISAVDDVMYIVNTVLQRSISTSQRDIIGSVIPTISRVLGSDFVGMIQRKMRDESYPKPVISGAFPPEDKIIAFIVLINSLDVSNDYISRIVSSRLSPPSEDNSGPPALKEIFPFSHDATFVSNTFTNLNTTFASKTTELISEGLRVLFSQVIKPRLRPILSDTFRDTDYSLSSSELSDVSRSHDDENPDTYLDLVTSRFEHGWEALMKPISRIMTSGPYNLLLEQTAKDLARALEKRAWNLQSKINALGGTRMERDISGIVGVVVKGKYSVRDHFQRVTQLLMCVNMDEEEWEAINADEGDEEDGVAGQARGHTAVEMPQMADVISRRTFGKIVQSVIRIAYLISNKWTATVDAKAFRGADQYTMDEYIDTYTRPSYHQPIADVTHKYEDSFIENWKLQSPALSCRPFGAAAVRWHRSSRSEEQRGTQHLMQIRNLLNN